MLLLSLLSTQLQAWQETDLESPHPIPVDPSTPSPKIWKQTNPAVSTSSSTQTGLSELLYGTQSQCWMCSCCMAVPTSYFNTRLHVNPGLQSDNEFSNCPAACFLKTATHSCPPSCLSQQTYHCIPEGPIPTHCGGAVTLLGWTVSGNSLPWMFLIQMSYRRYSAYLESRSSAVTNLFPCSEGWGSHFCSSHMLSPSFLWAVQYSEYMILGSQENPAQCKPLPHRSGV